ncbi:MAG: TetR/AcrR family transcriptional regulator [Brevibacterium sp.]|uniref:TetR/AcrR family transcriptional regulator n=1 Tax=Brevibacterium sp. TaxID=1701 RepID=UPI002647C629|nr:TetR/AcrR family transcriptional regulator [Brevibacterium sp.]MDN5806442.1 TetR/AcrR family transcriptional regulator [Brevibacterium sp.]MDN5833441.1 TetR/AcrR family transcriptional regulator [Brevibacterium sp.]MDN5876523.1 TetR/AcrR family transcriptional regulator [Brevibacterium sp.]MDN5908615.1 TetR/AcrR family transcriptional regulator [Brevibacterium sp.]MDN6133223.1 TetR/AcrR family transcriptional regulator [Brevibacterium sp.]
MSPRPQFSPAEVAARRSAILEASLDQIAAQGPEAVRMKDIAEAAGLSVGTLQYYFGSRESLLVHAFSTHSSATVDAIAGLTREQGTAWERLRSSLRAVPRIGDLRRRSQVWLELIAASTRNDYLRDSADTVFDSWRAHFRDLIEVGVDDGSFRLQSDVDLIVDILIAAIDGFDLAVAAGRNDSTPERIADSLELTAGSLLGVDDRATNRATNSATDSAVAGPTLTPPSV